MIKAINGRHHEFAYRVSYSTSGEGELEVGEFSVTVPLHVIKDKTGNYADEYEISLPAENEIEESHESDADSVLTYKEQDSDGDGVNDQLYIYNGVPTSSAINGYFEIAYKTTETTFNYADGTALADYVATAKERTVTKSSNHCNATIDTSASISSISFDTSTQKRYTAWQSEWGNDIKPANDSDYYYTVWYFTANLASNVSQVYNLKFEPEFTGTKDNVEFVAMNLANSGYSTSLEYDGLSYTDRIYGRMITKYPKVDYEPLTHFELKANLKATLHPADELDADSSISASKPFSWTAPKFVIPDGYNYNVYVHGNGNFQSQNKDMTYGHWSDDGDWHSSTWQGKIGSYYANYSLEELQKRKIDSVTVPVYAHCVNYYLGQTVKDGGDKKNPEDYLKKNMKLVFESGNVYLDEKLGTNESLTEEYVFKNAPLTSDDYEITRLDWNPTNSTYFFNSEAQKFEVSPISSSEAYHLFVKIGSSDTWKEVLTYIPASGTYNILDSSAVTSASGDSISFAGNVTKWKFETENAYGETNIECYSYVKLKNSENVMNTIKDDTCAELFMTNKDSMIQDGTELGSIEKADFDRIAKVQKYSYIDKKSVASSNSVKKKNYTITWRVSMYENMVNDFGKQYIDQNGGTFYDLLPENSTFDKASIAVRDSNDNNLSNNDYAVTTKENYKNSGRTLLTIHITAPSSYYTVFYDTVHSWDSIKDSGTEKYNAVAYETGNDEITGGYYDDPTKPSAKDGKDAFSDNELKKLFKDLNGEEDKTAKFIYSSASKDILTITSAMAGLTKKVLGGITNPDTTYTYKTKTSINGNYSYRLRYQNNYADRAKNIVLFDSLENYSDSKVSSAWHGTLQSVDVSQLKAKGINPIIYVSTVDNLSVNDHHDLTDTSIWTVANESTDYSTVKAIAIDASKKTDGTDYTLQAGESLVAYLYMKAPAESPDIQNSYPTAYNNVFMKDTMETDSGTIDYFIHQDYTQVQLVIAGNAKIRKLDSSTGKPISGISFRLNGTSDYGTEEDRILVTDKNGYITFENLEKGSYSLTEYDSTDDYLMDYTLHTVTIDNQGNAFIDGCDFEVDAFIFDNIPRIHTDITFYKRNYVVKSKNISGVRFKLTGTSDYGNDVVKYATSDNGGNVKFSNIELGTYTSKEIATVDGYIINSEEFQVTVDTSGNFQISTVNNSDMLELKKGKYYLYNEPKHSFDIFKQNSYNYAAVSGVTFNLNGVSDYGNSIDLNATTGNNGFVTFENLEAGTYVLQETAVTPSTDANAINVSLDSTKRVVRINKDDTITIDGLTNNGNNVFTLVNTAKGEKTVTVIKKWNDAQGKNVDHSKDLPTIHISATDPNGSEAVGQSLSVSAPVAEQSLFEKIGGAIKSIFVTEAKAEENTEYVDVTFDANGSTFDDGSTTNTIKYDKNVKEVTKYSHTDNISDDGTQNGNYGNNEKKTDVVTIPGAESLNVTVTYGGESASYDWVSIFSGAHSNYTAANDYSKADIVQKLGGGSHTSQAKTYTVQGDSVTFAWKSDSSGCGDGYGYYAIVKANIGATPVGTYKKPKAPEGKKFDGWSTTQNGDVVYKKDGSDIPKNQPLILYAHYVDFQWIDDWTYSLNDTDKTISLSQYNGDETDYTIPSSAVINGITYTTMFGNNTATKYSTINTRKIKHLSVEKGIICDANLARLFDNDKNLLSIDLSNLNTSKVTSMRAMFISCSSLTTLDLSSFDTSSVASMANMFSGCLELSAIKLGSKTKIANSNLPSPSVISEYTGKWTYKNAFNHTDALTADELMKYNGSKPGWYYWERVGEDPALQHYTSKKENLFTPKYDANGNMTNSPTTDFTKDGYWQKIDDSTYAYTFYVVDNSIPWYVWEDDVTGYTSSNPKSNPAHIQNGTETVTITNTDNDVATLKYGSLSITKTVVNAPANIKSYSFNVTLTDGSGNALSGTAVYGNVAFNNGVGTVAVKADETVTITGIPAGYHYSVSEISPSIFCAATYENETGIIPEDSTATVHVTNKFISVKSDTPSETGTFEIRSYTAGIPRSYWENHESSKLHYNVSFDNLNPGETYKYSFENKDYSFVADKDGKAEVIIEFDGINYILIRFNELPTGATYMITQENFKTSLNDDYKHVVFQLTCEEDYESGTIVTANNKVDGYSNDVQTEVEIVEANENAIFYFENNVTDPIRITLTKHVVKTKPNLNIAPNSLESGIAVHSSTESYDYYDTDDTFEFTFDVWNLTPGTVINTSFGNMIADNDGSAEKTVELSNKDSVWFELEPGTNYSITELANSKYTCMLGINDEDKSSDLKETKTGIIYVGSADSDKSNLDWFNVKNDNFNINVKELTVGNMSDKSKLFNVNMQFDKDTRAYTTFTVNNKKTGKKQIVAIDSEGKARFELGHEDEISFEGISLDEVRKALNASSDMTEEDIPTLVPNSHVGVAEDDYSSEGYTTGYGTSYDEDTKTITVTITNTKNVGVPTGNHTSTGIIFFGFVMIVGIAFFISKRKV